MGLVAYIDDSHASEKRRAPRRTLRLEVGVVTDATEARMMIHDLSPTGLLVEASGGPQVGEKLQIELPSAGAFPATVMWSSGRFTGCKFDQPLPQAAISAALLKGFDPSESRESGPGGTSAVHELQSRIQRLAQGPEQEVGAGADVVGEDDRLPLHTRARILLGLGAGSAGIWAAVLWVVGVI